MTDPDIDAFFRGEKIELFSEVGIDDVPEPDRGYILSFLPGAGSVIVFAKEIPAPVYSLPPKEKTRKMISIAESLDETAIKLSKIFNEEGIPARPVTEDLPVIFSEGKIRAPVRLKKVAAAGRLGTIGQNSLLLTRDYGPRVFLSAVVTGRNKQESKNDTDQATDDYCIGCGRCIKKCPVEAIGPDGVDQFKCRTISAWVRPSMVPVVKWVLGHPVIIKMFTPLAPLIARNITIPCDKCVTECPKS